MPATEFVAGLKAIVEELVYNGDVTIPAIKPVVNV